MRDLHRSSSEWLSRTDLEHVLYDGIVFESVQWSELFERIKSIKMNDFLTLICANKVNYVHKMYLFKLGLSSSSTIFIILMLCSTVKCFFFFPQRWAQEALYFGRVLDWGGDGGFGQFWWRSVRLSLQTSYWEFAFGKDGITVITFRINIGNFTRLQLDFLAYDLK